ncbi:MAG: SpoIIE family protein phosphatase [Actinomycetota bacterium]
MHPGGVPGTTSVRLAPELASAARARRAVREVLVSWGLEALADDVALGVSELVANAVLHARTDLQVVLERRGAGVRAEVRDESPREVSLPWHAALADGAGQGRPASVDEVLDVESMTGRGLLVVSSVADRWGVDTTDAGKTVWMEVATGGPDGTEHRANERRAPATGAGIVPVRLVAVPVRLALASDLNLDDLVREFQVLTLADQDIAYTVPTPLIRLVEEVLERHADARLAVREATHRAAAAGHRLMDVSLGLPPDLVPDLWHLTSVLEQVATFCRRGALLSLAPSDELSAYRRWFAGEVERQVNGSAPRPCPFPLSPPAAAAGPPQRRADDEVLATERTARTVAEQAAARLAGLQEVTAGLSRAVDSLQVADVILGRGLALLGAATGSFCLLQPDGETVEILRAVGYSSEVERRWGRFALSDDVPASESIRTGRAVYLHSAEECDERYPVFSRFAAERKATAILPLEPEPGRVLGAVAVGFRQSQEFPAADRAFLTALATQAAQALDRARLHESERRDHERFAFLAEASALLNASLEVSQTLHRLAALVVPRLADWCSIHLVEDGRPVFVTAEHADPAKRELACELHRRWPVQVGDPGLGSCLATGEPILFQVVAPELLDAVARDAEHARLLRTLGLGSAMVVALRAGGRVVGAMAMANEQGRVISEADFSLAQDLAERAGGAVANAQLFTERSHVARALQASLLPPVLPSADGVEFGGRYVAAGEGLDVGGDFFDVFATGSGWFVAVGDVCGKGVEAAAVTGLARHTIRSRALGDPSPGAVLHHLNDLLLRASADEAAAQGPAWHLEPRFCTVVAISLYREGDGVRATVCTAGHPCPLVRRRDGSVETVGVPGDLLGLLEDVALTEVEVHLGPGDLLVAFTDGITERHRGRRQFGDEGIAAVLAGIGDAGAAAVAERVEEAATDFVDGAPDDDMAIMVVRVPPA